MTSITLNPGTASAKTYNLTYDDSGNLVRKQNAAVPAEDTIYQWDGRNRLISITASAAGSSSTAAFKYDALGRRIERTVSQGVGTQRTQYVYDGIQAIGELVDGRLAATILTGLNIDEVIARTVNVATATSENPIATKTYLTDALGSVLAVLRADQSAEAFYAYSPHGETSQLGADPDRPVSAYQYTARENDGAVGGTDGGSLYFYRARFYDPVLKRFLSEDPIGLAGGFNLSAYLAGDPVSFTDPTGEFLFVPMLVGALWGAGTDIAIQLIMNGGRLECIDLGQVALSAALGAVGGGVGGYVAKLRNVRQAYQNGLAAAREADLSAQQAWATRRALGQAGKQNTPPGARGLIYGRNTRQYGDELGPAFDPVKMADPMKTLTDTNKYADQLLKLPPRGLPSAGGAAGGAAGAGIGGGGSECGCNN
jgi:RHS repeat-associated protein